MSAIDDFIADLKASKYSPLAQNLIGKVDDFVAALQLLALGAPGGAAGGDLSGNYPNPTVAKIQGNAVLAGVPLDGQVLQWVNAAAQFQAKTLAAAANYGPGFVAGRFYTTPGITGLLQFAITANTLYAVPFFVPVSTTFTKIGVQIPNAGGGGNIELGIYNNNNGIPGTLLLDAGSVAVGAGGAVTIAINQILTPGWYWLAVAGSSTPQISGPSGAAAAITRDFTGGTDMTQAGAMRVTGGWVFAAGSLPSPFPALTYTNNSGPTVWLSP